MKKQVKEKYILKNWSFNEYHVCLIAQGNVYNNPKFKDGTFIYTSRVKDIKENDDHVEVETKNSIYCLYPDDIDSEFDNEFPNFYKEELCKDIEIDAYLEIGEKC